MGFKYLVLMEGKIYLIENQDDEMLGLLVFFFNKLCAKMMFSLLLRLQMLNNFVLGCTGRLRQMGLIVITLLIHAATTHFDWMGLTCCINMLLRDQNYFLIVWSSGVIICLM